MEQLHFNCGEYLPGKKPITPIVPVLPIPIAPRVPAPRPCCTEIPGVPALPKPPEEDWVCVCAAACTEDPTACLENRACVKRSDVPRGMIPGRGFASRQECIDRGFGEPPCWKCGVRCMETTVPCPPPRTDLPRQIIRECIRCPNASNQSPECSHFPSLADCRPFCATQNFDCPTIIGPPDEGGRRRIGPITPDLSGGPPRIRPVLPGPITPTVDYKCIIRNQYCPPPRENILEIIKQHCEWCFEDSGNGIGRRRDGSIGPRPPDCPPQTSQQCARSGGTNGGPCTDIRVNICPSNPITGGEGGGVVTRPNPVVGVGDGGGGTVTRPPRPITPTDSYTCERIYCPPPRENLLKSKRCVVCFTDFGNGTGRRRDGTIGPRPSDCPEKSLLQCENENCRVVNNICPTGPIDPDGPPISIGAGGTGVLGFGQSQNLNNILDLNSKRLLGNKFELNLGVQQNNLFSNQIERKQRVINIDEEAAKARTSDETGRSFQTIYHRDYNLFQYPTTNTVKFAPNSRYLNIFRDVVPEEVAYILNISDSSSVWSEYSYTQLTKDKLLASLNYDLVTALSNLHYIDGTQISLDYFIETLRMLLAEARLDEFDDQFFLNLAKKQKEDEFLIIENSTDKNVQEQAALGIIAHEAVNSDPDYHEDEFKKLLLLRTRRLNTDIKAVIPLEAFDGVQTPVPLVEPGIEVITVSDSGLPIDEPFVSGVQYAPLGEGHGYYFSATLVNGSIVPIRTQNQLSSTYYIPPATRDVALRFFNRDPALTLRVTSLINRSEFDNNFYSSTIAPSYYALNLSSLGDLERINPLVREISGSYTKLTSDTEITTHTRTYGVAVSKVFINYDDPFLAYARDSNTIVFNQSDVSFEGMYPDTGAEGGQIISRNVAFGLIIIPVRGSKFNPFSQKSQLITYEYPYTRELKVINHIHFTKDIANVPVLEEKNLYNETGQNKLGLVETPNAQNIIFAWNSSSLDYSGLYFSGGNYINEQPGKESPVTRRLVHDLIEGTLSSTYGYLSSITWWDIYRRLRAKDMAEIAFQIPKKFLEKLANGLRGYRIRNVLQREGNIGTRLTTVDTVILNVENRKPTNTI